MRIDEFIGNKTNRILLDHCLRKDTLSHAYIFAGPEGIGKRSLAMILAKAVHCGHSRGGLDCCDQCASCRKIDGSNHPDVKVIMPESKVFQVDQIRKIIQDIYFQPFEGPRRVFILEEADRMNEAAANCLLKTLEEPPEKSVLVLITTNMYALLPTILSRGQVLKFLPIPSREIEAYLLAHGAIKPSHAKAAARLSLGSIGAAISFDSEGYEEMRSRAFHLLALMVQENEHELVGLLPGLTSSKKMDRFELFLHVFVTILRDMVILNHCHDTLLVLHQEHLEVLSGLHPRFPLPVIQDLLHDVEELFRKRAYNLRQEAQFLNIVLRRREDILRRKSA